MVQYKPQFNDNHRGKKHSVDLEETFIHLLHSKVAFNGKTFIVKHCLVGKQQDGTCSIQGGAGGEGGRGQEGRASFNKIKNSLFQSNRHQRGHRKGRDFASR